MSLPRLTTLFTFLAETAAAVVETLITPGPSFDHGNVPSAFAVVTFTLQAAHVIG